MAKNISEKTLQDLEFNTVLEQVANYCISDLGKEQILAIKPITDPENLHKELQLVNEYLSSFISENKVPNHAFENISQEIFTLNIENSFLEAASCLKSATLSETTNELLLFFKKFESYFPTLFQVSQQVELTTVVIDTIKKIVTPYGEVANNASPVLKQIRRDISKIRGKIGESFTRDLSRYSALGYLDDIRETVVDNHRVLAVLAMYRRKVTGNFLGASKTGSIVYIAPQATLNYSRELQDLAYEEQQEVTKILKELASVIRPFTPLLQEYLDYLTHLDVIASKASNASRIIAR